MVLDDICCICKFPVGGPEYKIPNREKLEFELNKIHYMELKTLADYGIEVSEDPKEWLRLAMLAMDEAMSIKLNCQKEQDKSSYFRDTDDPHF